MDKGPVGDSRLNLLVPLLNVKFSLLLLILSIKALNITLGQQMLSNYFSMNFSAKSSIYVVRIC